MKEKKLAKDFPEGFYHKEIPPAEHEEACGLCYFFVPEQREVEDKEGARDLPLPYEAGECHRYPRSGGHFHLRAEADDFCGEFVLGDQHIRVTSKTKGYLKCWTDYQNILKAEAGTPDKPIPVWTKRGDRYVLTNVGALIASAVETGCDDSGDDDDNYNPNERACDSLFDCVVHAGHRDRPTALMAA